MCYCIYSQTTGANTRNYCCKQSAATLSIGEMVVNIQQLCSLAPQGSILSPLLFNMVMLPNVQIFQNNISYNNYDDNQIYIALSADEYGPVESLTKCIEEINNWMCSNFLQLNTIKTEVIVFVAKEKRLKVTDHLESLSLTTKTQVRNFCIIIVSDINLNNHIKT